MMSHSASAIDFTEKWEENAKQELATGCLSFDTFIVLQRIWSAKTFGPSSIRGPLGPLEHLRKEVVEAIDVALGLASVDASKEETYEEISLRKMDLIEEYADLFFLVVDAVWRSGFTPTEFKQAITQKFITNKERRWPDWTTRDPNSAIEHNREGE